MLLSEEYRFLLERMHQKNRAFGSGSKRRKERILSLGYTDILDYGCGKGKLRIDGIHRYDPGMKEFNNEPKPAQLIVCTDVLEHVEPNFLEEVLRHIHSLMLAAGYFTIGIKPAKKKLPDGRNAHLIIEGPSWWMNKLEPFFHVVESQLLRDGKENDERELEVILKPKR